MTWRCPASSSRVEAFTDDPAAIEIDARVLRAVCIVVATLLPVLCGQGLPDAPDGPVFPFAPSRHNRRYRVRIGERVTVGRALKCGIPTWSSVWLSTSSRCESVRAAVRHRDPGPYVHVRSVGFHLFEDRARALILVRDLAEVAVEMAFDLSFGFRNEPQAPSVAGCPRRHRWRTSRHTAAD